MSIPVNRRRRLGFGLFEADLSARELYKRGLPVPLQDQPFQILTILLERPGEVVTREDLRQKLWPGDTFVDFDHGLNNAINRLREALVDSAESPRYIETLPRRGYRFVAPVESRSAEARGPTAVSIPALPAAEAPAPADKSRIGETAAEPAGRHRKAKLWAGALAFAALLGLILGLNLGGLRQRLFPRSSPEPIRSIAVLPFDNLTGDPGQEYFVDGMTDALITDLAQIATLRVISRASTLQYRGSRKPLPQIARELHVDAVVEGAVVRSGDRVRIDAQLIEAASDRHLWARSYDRQLRDVVALQGEV